MASASRRRLGSATSATSASSAGARGAKARIGDRPRGAQHGVDAGDLLARQGAGVRSLDQRRQMQQVLFHRTRFM